MGVTSDQSGWLKPWLASPQFIHRVLLIILAGSLLLRLDSIFLKKAIQYDEAISYLSATCNQQRYALEAESVESRPARYWKAFLQPGTETCLKQIAYDLREYDIHPPLYFWLLHLWVRAVGVEVWTGPVLNSLIAVLTIAFLFATTKTLFQRSAEGLLVALTYAFSPSVLLISQEARQYDLLALLTILFLWIMLKVARGAGDSRPSMLLLLATVVGLGSSIHHQFAFPVLGALLLVVYRWWQIRERTFAIVAGTVLVGYVAARILHPLSTTATRLPSLQAVWDELPYRSSQVLLAYSTFYYVLVPFLILLLIMVVARGKEGAGRASIHLELGETFGPVPFLLLVTAGAVSTMYLSTLSPAHAMGPPKYLSMVWPLISVVPVYLLRLVRYRASVALYLVLVPLLIGLVFPLQMRMYTLPDPAPALSEHSLVVVDNPARGVFLQLAWNLPEEMPVIVAWQDTLLSQQSVWLEDLQPGTLYISGLSFQNSAVKQQELLDLFEMRGFVVIPYAEQASTPSTGFRGFELR
jgi:hypothetical protein